MGIVTSYGHGFRFPIYQTISIKRRIQDTANRSTGVISKFKLRPCSLPPKYSTETSGVFMEYTTQWTEYQRRVKACDLTDIIDVVDCGKMAY